MDFPQVIEDILMFIEYTINYDFYAPSIPLDDLIALIFPHSSWYLKMIFRIMSLIDINHILFRGCHNQMQICAS